MQNEELSRLIKEAQGAVTTEDFARAHGISTSTLRNWRQGRTGIGESELKNAGALVRILGARGAFVFETMGFSREQAFRWAHQFTGSAKAEREERRELIKKK